MKKMHCLLFILPVILMVACDTGIHQEKTPSAINPCIDCPADSISMIWANAHTAADTLYALMAEIDNFGGAPRNLDHKIQQLDKLILLNKKLKLIDIHPYENYREGMVFWIQNDQRKSIEKIKEAIDAFDRQKKIMGDFSILNGLRLYYSTAGLKEARVAYFREKLNYYELNGPVENTATCYHAIAGSYTFDADYNNAISNYLKAAEIYKTYSPGGYSNEINAIGRYYYLWGNYDRAFHYLELGIRLCVNLGRWMNVAESKIALSIIQKEQKEYAAALNTIDSALVISNSLKDYQLRAISLTEKAGILLEIRKPDSAFSCLKEALHIRDSLSFPLVTNNGELEINFYLYKYYNQIRNELDAESELTEAYSLAIQFQDDKLIQKYRKELATYYEEHNKTGKAADLALSYINLGDSIQSNFNKSNIAAYENEQEEVKRNVEIQQLINQKKAQRKSFVLGGVFLFLLAGGLFSRLQFIRKTRKQLKDKNILIEKEKLRAEQSLEYLKATQTQLIHSEKMASLGELTAGIAHEIQNPLNFVNNFSEVNLELIEELKEGINKGNLAETKAVAEDITQNEQKINFHGKRADAIVKGMLQHSRSSNGVRELTDINTLADEYLRLAYHGLRAKDKSFYADFKMEADNALPKVNVVPQDIGRVILNLINNAFYATSEKKKQQKESYMPEVIVITKKLVNGIEIRVRDNGNGIPQNVLDKIFQPFFTTKPTGEGTGLGLSLSYDIIKAHGGELKVETNQGEGTEFIIQLAN